MTGDFRERFQQIQAQFIDEPQSAVKSARSLVEEAVSRMMEDLRHEDAGGKADTEQLRMAMMRYREMIYHLTGDGGGADMEHRPADAPVAQREEEHPPAGAPTTTPSPPSPPRG